MFKKLLALILALLMVSACLSGCSQSPDNSAEIETLQQQIEDLQVLVNDLNDRINLLEMGSIAQWALTAEPLTQGSGAAITLHATPTKYQEGQVAQFRVVLEDALVAELYCDWIDGAYTASVELDAADGYSYYLVLTDPNGRQEQQDLSSPANPTQPELVYLYSSLLASCTLEIYEAEISGGILSLKAGTATVQMPTLTANGEAATCVNAALVLQLNGTEVQRQSLNVPGEAFDVHSLDVGGITFAIPELAESSQLDLLMEVTLSDGQMLTQFGCSWYYADGELIQAVG